MLMAENKKRLEISVRAMRPIAKSENLTQRRKGAKLKAIQPRMNTDLRR
jgi:hypothetical protein